MKSITARQLVNFHAMKHDCNGQQAREGLLNDYNRGILGYDQDTETLDYYNKGTFIMSNFEFDKLRNNLVQGIGGE